MTRGSRHPTSIWAGLQGGLRPIGSVVGDAGCRARPLMVPFPLGLSGRCEAIGPSSPHPAHMSNCHKLFPSNLILGLLRPGPGNLGWVASCRCYGRSHARRCQLVAGRHWQTCQVGGSYINSGSSVIKLPWGSPGTFRRAVTVHLAHGLGIGVGTGGAAYVRIVLGEMAV